MENELYFTGFFYYKTNAKTSEEAVKELEAMGLNMDNVNEIELRDKEGIPLDGNTVDYGER